jgi:small GTP-binding protein
VFTTEYYVEYAKKIQAAGADSICIKDMAALLTPYKTEELVKALKANVDLPIDLHTHYTSGLASMCLLKGIEAGADIIMERGINGAGGGMVKAGGNVITKFIENAKVSAGSSVTSESILHSKIEAGTEVVVTVFDTPGPEGFKSINWMCNKNIDGIIITYDITDKENFNEVEYWINQIENDSSLNEKIVFIVGNKSDLEDRRVISKEEGEKLAEKHGVMFSECSAKTGENVNFIFDELIKKCYPLVREEEEKRREIEEEKLKKNLKILNKYLSF